jgi:peptidyl-prolyl cis-trans isomerase A (cyclophilin A)
LRLNRPLPIDHTNFNSKPPIVTSINDGTQPYKVRFIINIEKTNSQNPTFEEIIVQVNPKWAPLGAKQFHELIKSKFYDNCRFFRVLKDFMGQTGINGDPKEHNKWKHRVIIDDPVLQSNTRGRVTFATSGKNTRTTQIFFNFGDNRYLDKQGFSPFGEVITGLDVLDKLYSKYGEGGKGDGSDGKGPNQGRISNEGNTYLEKLFPKLSYIVKTEFI